MGNAEGQLRFSSLFNAARRLRIEPNYRILAAQHQVTISLRRNAPLDRRRRAYLPKEQIPRLRLPEVGAKPQQEKADGQGSQISNFYGLITDSPSSSATLHSLSSAQTK